ncbi:hypothetical protein C0Q70_13851 [Pomacea canaliculata]|uniref:G-protein coupled receptors family 1 profile domain-containing protein n=1 Tax=Pomacea canaliculata TaxID=400727 RepID=A0A2T7NYD7_POMCA|nr:hypothetical protein C0Q70_13851 [Pomacea canaliculata]
MNVTTWTRCCNVTTVTSSTSSHDQIIGSITTVTVSQVKTDSVHVLVREIAKVISNEVCLWIIGVITVGLQPLMFLFGFPGNILCAAVFYKLGLRERINLCVFALALTDLVTITVTFCVGVEKALRDLLGVELNFFIQYFAGPTDFLWSSMFVSTTIACERCFCVVSPFKAQRYIKTSTTAVIITVATVVLVGGMCAIAGPKHKAVTVYDLATNSTRSVIYVTRWEEKSTDIGRNHKRFFP